MVVCEKLREWLTAHGASFHAQVVLTAGPHGVAVLAPNIVEDTSVVACPLTLIITPDVATQAVRDIFGANLEAWSERQRIVAYLALHHLTTHPTLGHLPYVECLPPAADLLTSLHFTTAEMELLRGTNLYGATLDRERDWRAEWAQCQAIIDPALGTPFTWSLYLTASTHLSSRAFPSSILSSTPTLVASPSTYPVLIPGVDLLNHKRAQPVTWVVSTTNISLVVHPTPALNSDALVEVFNNYGPKPNDELILGYGFSIPDNPDDTIALQIGGSSQKWIVGRNAHNVDGIWSDIQARIADGKNEHAFEDDLDTAALLSDMVQAKLDGIQTIEDVRRCDYIRPTVRVMLEHYIAGQRDILESILQFSNEKQEAAIETARQQGIDLVFEDDV